MALEPDFRWLDDLNPDNPDEDDPVSQGDDHLRGIKSTLLFNLSGNQTETRIKLLGLSRLLFGDVAGNTIARHLGNDALLDWIGQDTGGDDVPLARMQPIPEGNARFLIGDGEGNLQPAGQNVMRVRELAADHAIEATDQGKRLRCIAPLTITCDVDGLGPDGVLTVSSSGGTVTIAEGAGVSILRYDGDELIPGVAELSGGGVCTITYISSNQVEIWGGRFT